jgi:multicomponent Na+:H+ antiporter subunit F
MTFLEISLNISIVLITLAFIMIAIRLFIGPTLEDRVVALDLITTSAIAFIAVYSMLINRTTIMDVGIVIALLAFLGTVAFAYYLERRIK